MSTKNPRPPLSSKAAGRERRENPPSHLGTRTDAAETPQMTIGGPKSETISRSGSEKYRFERNAVVDWSVTAVRTAVLKASQPVAADDAAMNWGGVRRGGAGWGGVGGGEGGGGGVRGGEAG